MAKTKFSPEFLQELKERNNIVEVASQYFSLDQRGYNYWACCPFHHEKTPSFSINSIDQYYHCFGCGVSGSVIDLVKEMENLSFPESVQFLAKRAGMPVPESDFDGEKAAELKRKKDRLLQVLLLTARFYLRNLYSGRADRYLEYISDRKLSPATAKKFGMGASLDSRSLPAFLLDSGFTKEELVESGVCSISDEGRLFDFQSGRLVVPIINQMGEVIAFGGRILGQKRDGVPKYKNTRETLVFNKRKTLFNLNLLKKYKQNNALPYVIMVEGYMDAISLYQAGFQNVVASMGTSLTSDQARLLKRYCENVLISYDQDGAGQAADLRGLDILRKEDLNVKVVLMPEGEDPDDVCRKRGAAAYQKCLDEAMPLSDYKLHTLERQFDLGKPDGRRLYERAALPVIRQTENAAEREDLLKTVRDKTGFSLQAVQKDLESYVPEKEPQLATPLPERTIPIREKSDRLTKACRFILGAVLFRCPYAENYRPKEEDFKENVHTVIVKYVTQCMDGGQKIRVSDLFDIFDEDTAEFNAILDLNVDGGLWGDGAEQYFRDSVRTVERQHIQKQIDWLSARSREATELEERRKLLQELSRYTQELKKYN